MNIKFVWFVNLFVYTYYIYILLLFYFPFWLLSFIIFPNVISQLKLPYRSNCRKNSLTNVIPSGIPKYYQELSQQY